MAGPVKRLSRAEQQEQTRLALLDAAIDLFIERGVEATSIEEVTARAGFSRGAFYSNFATKDELFLDACRRFLVLLHAAARPPADDEVPPDAGDAFRERTTRLRAVTHDSASMFLAEISLYAIRHPEVQEDVAAMRQEQLTPAVAFVRAVLEQGGITEPAVSHETLANIAQFVTFGAHLFGKVDDVIDAEAAVATAMDLIMKGVTASSDRTM